MESERDRRVREKAYELWESRGRPEGEADRHWLEAEGSFGSQPGEARKDAPGGTDATPRKASARSAAPKAKSEAAVPKPKPASSAAPSGKSAAAPSKAAKPKSRT